MYKAITILILSLWGMHLNAQFVLNKSYKIYMNDSRVFRGELISSNEDFIELKLLDGHIEKIPLEYISNFIPFFREPFPKITDYNSFDDLQNGTTYRIGGPYMIFQIGYSPNRSQQELDDTLRTKPYLTVISGYQFDRGSMVGLGIDIDLFNKSFMPIFVDYHHFFIRGPVSLFGSANLGYSFSYEQFQGDPWPRQKGGFMYQLGGGITVPSKHQANFIFEMVYRHQYSKRRIANQDFMKKNRIKDFIIKVGVIF